MTQRSNNAMHTNSAATSRFPIGDRRRGAGDGERWAARFDGCPESMQRPSQTLRLLNGLGCAVALCACGVLGETNQPAGNDLRPFKSQVEAISSEPFSVQYKSIIELSRPLVSEGFAFHTRQSDKPHFGHLARELAAQGKFDLMRAIVKEREINPYKYCTIAELLASKLDPAAFELLVTNSSTQMPPPERDDAFEYGKDMISGEGIPEYSALSLRHYLSSEVYRERAESHLIQILKEHRRTGVRAFAAKALGESKSLNAIKALRAALTDEATVTCLSCGEDNVADYARRALAQIETKPSL